MRVLDFELLDALDPEAYQAQKPYPWANPSGLIRPEAFEPLVDQLPDLSLFTASFGRQRRAGQYPHDRYTLEYTPEVELAPIWRDFLSELTSERYKRALCRLSGVPSLTLNFHWHYAPRGCSVSPHCDSSRKLGSHIFYLNHEDDWRPEWGGETLVLDDGGRFDPRSAPSFEAFEKAIPAETLGNRSFLFSRRGNSWHGVKEIRCPEGHMRKVFIAVFNRDRWYDRLRFAVSKRDIARF